MRFDKDWADEVRHNASWYRKTALTEALPIGPLAEPGEVTTKEGLYKLPVGWKGYIAFDTDGDIYPIDWVVFEASYEHAVPDVQGDA